MYPANGEDGTQLAAHMVNLLTAFEDVDFSIQGQNGFGGWVESLHNYTSTA